MPEPEQKTLGPWLELSEAADYLGIHFTTLRRWADAGQVPCIRTPGGHRRFKRSELDVFISDLRQGASHAITALQKLEQPAVLGRAAHSGVRAASWYGQLDESQRSAMRAEGRKLLAVLMQYATRSDGGEAFLDEGRRLATRYGQVFCSVGLSLVDTVRAFTQVRRSITDAVYEAGTLSGPPDTDSWQLYDRMNHFLDTMLLAILEAYDEARRPDLEI